MRRYESPYFLSPAQAHITWILKGVDGIEKDYEHFSPPFLLALDEVYNKIRNINYRYMASGSLFPEEVQQYDSYSIREALSNAMGHQDYRLGRLADFDKMLTNKLPQVLNDKQRKNKVRNLLQKMCRDTLVASKDQTWYLADS